MLKFKRNRQPVPKRVKQNKAVPSRKSASAELNRVQKNIYRQAMLAGLTVVLTIVILFAMTSAWYTNIVQTSGLVFEAESWGFDGKITVNEESIVASPGEDGVVHLEVQNTSDSISAISINVSKAEMAEPMQQRLFFYVDTRMNRNEEDMDRVYVNNYEGYTYTLFGQGNLTLTEQTNNAPQLKWEWVYDVLGYYILAQPIEVQEEDGTTSQVMFIKEYLRPIEYDYDLATTSYGYEETEPVEGAEVATAETTAAETEPVMELRLQTVDGKTSPYKYLRQLSENDGYAGVIDNNPVDGFYPVEVDEKTGYGVYAYLCTPAEVELATIYDTNLGELAYKKAKKEELTQEQLAQLFHQATLTISAQKNESTAVNVNTLAALEQVIAEGKADVIQLSSDITLPVNQTLNIPKNTRVMIDLNSHSITSEFGTAINANPGSSLTLLNGAIKTNETESSSASYGIHTTGAEVVMSNVAISGYKYGIYMGDNEGSNVLDSRVHMVGCNISAKGYAVFVSGNGLLSSQKTQLIIEDSTLKSDSIVISGNGTATGNGRWGTDIQIVNSIIEGNVGTVGSGIYQPQKDSTLTVIDSTVSGYNGIAIKGGSVSIVDSIVTGKGAYQKPESAGSGFTDTGDAVYIETSYGYEILLEISGNKTALGHAADSSRCIRVFGDNTDCVKVNIVSGEFMDKQPEEYIAEGSTQSATSAGSYKIEGPKKEN